MKKDTFSLSRILFHPSTLAVLSGLIGAFIGFLINLVSGGNTSQTIWIALTFAILFSLGITAWQVYSQEKSSRQWMTMLQETIFQTYFLTLLADKPEISQMAQQRLGQVLKNLDGEQQLSMLKFFSHNGLPITFIGDGLQGSTALVGADLHKMELSHIQLEQTNLSRVNFSEANLSGANLSGASLYRANLSGANLSQSQIKGSDLRGVDLRGANLTDADFSGSGMAAEKGEKVSGGAADAQSGATTASAPLRFALRVNLGNAILAHAKLRSLSLIGADLGGANLQGADLTYSNLSYANLQSANLTGANLTAATFDGSNLQGADLTDAILTWASFIDTDLRGAKVTDEHLQALGTNKNIKRDPLPSESNEAG